MTVGIYFDLEETLLLLKLVAAYDCPSKKRKIHNSLEAKIKEAVVFIETESKSLARATTDHQLPEAHQTTDQT